VSIPDSANPEETAEFNIELERLSKALEHLSPTRREVIGLRFFAGLSAIEAGKILGKKPAAVRQMQSAAIRSLRAILDMEGQL